jgi:tetratricopeptide (TPR) repeat protein
MESCNGQRRIRNSDAHSRIAIIGVLISLFVTQVVILFVPIIPSDTDLWFHLNEGRYLIDNLTIPTTNFFSYLEPVQAWINYSWLFQGIVYVVMHLSDYQGLIVLRGLVMFGVGLLLFLIIAKDNIKNPLLVILFVLVFLALYPRISQIRPQVFTYLLMLATIFIFEKKRLFWLLPFIVLLQTNVHGIAYIFIFAIFACYGLEYYVQYRKGRNVGLTRRQVLVACLSPAFIFINPYFLDILHVPFDNYATFFHYYIGEMIEFSIQSFAVYQFWPITSLSGSLQRMLILAGIVGACSLLYMRSLRISHVLMLLFGLFLASKGLRFAAECLILASPLMAAAVGRIMFPEKKWIVFTSVGMSFVVFLLFAGGLLHARPGYPVPNSRIPAASARFVQSLPEGQRVLSEPTFSGYLAWALYPRHKIFMDLEMVLFDDMAAYEAMMALRNPIVLQRHIERYNPSIIIVPLKSIDNIVGTLDAFEYRPLFIDRGEIVFSGSEAASTWPSLESLSSMQQTDVDMSEMPEDEQKIFLEQLARIVAFDETVYEANVLLGNAHLQLQNPLEALAAADRLIRHHPENSSGYAIKGQALHQLQRYEDAETAFHTATSRSGALEKKVLYRNYYVTLFMLGKYERAYRILLKGYNPFSHHDSPEIPYELAVAAFNARDWDSARLFIKMALLVMPEAESAKIQELERIFGIVDNCP